MKQSANFNFYERGLNDIYLLYVNCIFITGGSDDNGHDYQVKMTMMMMLMRTDDNGQIYIAVVVVVYLPVSHQHHRLSNCAIASLQIQTDICE